jgi:hypothetical protein
VRKTAAKEGYYSSGELTVSFQAGRKQNNYARPSVESGVSEIGFEKWNAARLKVKSSHGFKQNHKLLF